MTENKKRKFESTSNTEPVKFQKRKNVTENLLSFNLLILPVEVWLEILKFLNPKDITRLAQLNKGWQYLLNNRNGWGQPVINEPQPKEEYRFSLLIKAQFQLQFELLGLEPELYATFTHGICCSPDEFKYFLSLLQKIYKIKQQYQCKFMSVGLKRDEEIELLQSIIPRLMQQMVDEFIAPIVPELQIDNNAKQEWLANISIQDIPDKNIMHLSDKMFYFPLFRTLNNRRNELKQLLKDVNPLLLYYLIFFSLLLSGNTLSTFQAFARFGFNIIYMDLYSVIFNMKDARKSFCLLNQAVCSLMLLDNLEDIEILNHFKKWLDENYVSISNSSKNIDLEKIYFNLILNDNNLVLVDTNISRWWLTLTMQFHHYLNEDNKINKLVKQLINRPYFIESFCSENSKLVEAILAWPDEKAVEKNIELLANNQSFYISFTESKAKKIMYAVESAEIDELTISFENSVSFQTVLTPVLCKPAITKKMDDFDFPDFDGPDNLKL